MNNLFTPYWTHIASPLPHPAPPHPTALPPPPGRVEWVGAPSSTHRAQHWVSLIPTRLHNT